MTGIDPSEADHGTWFATVQRSSRVEIDRMRRELARHPDLIAALDAFPEPALILDGHRQILFANDKILALLDRPLEDLLGQRPGEALGCIHAWDRESGCGTGRFCRDCGAGRAMIESQRSGAARRHACSLRLAGAEGERAMQLEVHCTPFAAAGETFTIFAVRDVGAEHRREILERIFFHDALNVAGGISALSELLPLADAVERPRLEVEVHELALRLIEEIEAQRDLRMAELGELRAHAERVDVVRLCDELAVGWRLRGLAGDATIRVERVGSGSVLETDRSTLRRVIDNLVKNALEAALPGEEIAIVVDAARGTVAVRNAAVMSAAVQRQLFHRSFTTKGGTGRGIGTWSVNLLTTTVLGGRVEFTSCAGAGTEFRIVLEAVAAGLG